ncbi:MAG: sigma-70 family RNA polymerase sigma factor [Pirellulaceae bacterium]|jgi:RNA polymerase sigma factor (sigma-70 family)|nr:sigma-70 family RNA polymerase sigma factor [Pirellulaceae bacterium]MDP7016658.1 sigma-70 family RNA polymerase sigma factor [Pirellulaceae bacterium]
MGRGGRDDNGRAEIGRADDGRLIADFVRSRDDEVFAELFRRYAPLVMSVCQRVLGDRHAAEDALQATFLVLAERADTIRRPGSLASWLYGVAFRISTRLAAARSKRREEPLSDEERIAANVHPLVELATRHQQLLVDELLLELPATYRDPLLLRYFVGRTNEQIACEIGISVSAVEGRLKRGRKRLRGDLLRRGVTLALAPAALGLAAQCSAAVDPATLTQGLTSDADISTTTRQLANEEIATMRLVTTSRAGAFASAAAIAMAICLVGYGAMQYASGDADDASTIYVAGQTAESQPPTQAIGQNRGQREFAAGAVASDDVDPTAPGKPIYNEQLRRFKFHLEVMDVTAEMGEHFALVYKRPDNPEIVGAFPDPRTNSIVVIGPPEAEDAIRSTLARWQMESLGLMAPNSLESSYEFLAQDRRRKIVTIAELEMEIAELDESPEEQAKAKLEVARQRLAIFETELRVVERQMGVVVRNIKRLKSVPEDAQLDSSEPSA